MQAVPGVVLFCRSRARPRGGGAGETEGIFLLSVIVWHCVLLILVTNKEETPWYTNGLLDIFFWDVFVSRGSILMAPYRVIHCKPKYQI